MWDEEDNMLVSTIECDDFRSAVDFVNKIAVLAEEAGHHPDLLIHDYKNVTVMLTTHDKGGVTQQDHALAAQIDGLLDL